MFSEIKTYNTTTSSCNNIQSLFASVNPQPETSNPQPETKNYRYYLGKYEKEINHTTNTTTEYYYVGGPMGNIAVYISENGAEPELYYTITDHLSSIVAIADEDGEIIEEQRYDPWGVYRNPISGQPEETPQLTMLFRGYTGHEMLPEFGLINMNGRLYDPVIARVLSPDNYVQNPYNPQNYNRYSYCYNNPLKYTDPDGEWVHLVVGGVIGGVVNLAVNWNNVDGFWQGLAAFGIGAGSGVAAAATGGASLLAQAGVAVGTSALTAGTNSVIAQTDKNFKGNVDWGAVGQSSAIGGASGLVGFGAARGTASLFKGDVVLGSGFRIDGKSIPGQVIKQGAGGFAGGYAGGFTAGYLYTGDLSQANQAGLQGGFLGGTIGAGMGAGSAYYNAKKQGYNPWTGKSNEINQQLVSPSVEKVYNQIKDLDNQGKVQQLETRSHQEVMILIEHNNIRMNIRIETHAINGVQMRHMNVQMWILSPDKTNQINNFHIPLE